MPKRKDRPIETDREVWRSMQYLPRKMKCDRDTAKALCNVFGDKIMNDITIIDNKIFISTTDKEVKDDNE